MVFLCSDWTDEKSGRKDVTVHEEHVQHVHEINGRKMEVDTSRKTGKSLSLLSPTARLSLSLFPLSLSLSLLSPTARLSLSLFVSLSLSLSLLSPTARLSLSLSLSRIPYFLTKSLSLSYPLLLG